MNAPLPLARPDLLRSLARIGDRWLAADDGRSFAVRNPASGAPLADVPLMGAGETRRAIAAAETALTAWRQTTAKERATLLMRLQAHLLAHQDDLARLITAEQEADYRPRQFPRANESFCMWGAVPDIAEFRKPDAEARA